MANLKTRPTVYRLFHGPWMAPYKLALPLIKAKILSFVDSKVLYYTCKTNIYWYITLYKLCVLNVYVNWEKEEETKTNENVRQTLLNKKRLRKTPQLSK